MNPVDPAEFCADVRGRLVAALVLYTGDRHLAEELAQEALARAWERWDTVGSMASPEGWTFRTARNLAVSRWRRRAIERRARQSVAPVVVAPAEGVAIRDAVSALPERQRATLVARFYLGLSVAEAADHLGCAEGTVKAATSQALERLRSQGFIEDLSADERPGA